jgi:outer membrane protein TolC
MATGNFLTVSLRVGALIIAAGTLISTVLAQAVPETQKLTIKDCIESALLHNLSLQADRIDPEIAQEQTEVAKGEFDPTLDLTAGTRVIQQSATLSVIDDTRRESFTGRAGVSKKVDTGASVSVSTNMDRLFTDFAGANPTLNPAYDADVTLSVRQPLLDGFGTEVNRATRNRSLVGVDRADYTMQANILEVVQQTEAAFYNLAFQRASLNVRLAGLEVAQSFLEENTVRRENGMATNLDVTQAEVGLADQRALVLNSRQEVSDAEDLLLSLIGEFAFDQSVPELVIDLSIGDVPSIGGAYGLALEHQPKYLAALSLTEQLRFDVILARSQSRPTLDLGGALGYSGRASSFRDAYQEIPDGNGYAWQVDLTFRVPWGQREGKARLRQSELVLQREELRIRDLEQVLMKDIRTSIRAVETGLERVDIAQLRRRLSNEEYELEKAKFEAGLSTSRLVLDAQQRSDQARVSELQAFVDLKNAWSELQRVQGTSLHPYGIAMVSPSESNSKSSEGAIDPSS